MSSRRESFMKIALYWAHWAVSSCVLVTATPLSAHAQEMTGMPTPLAILISEAQSHNSQVAAAEHAEKAATHVAAQVTTLPDPQFTVQSFRSEERRVGKECRSR